MLGSRAKLALLDNKVKCSWSGMSNSTNQIYETVSVVTFSCTARIWGFQGEFQKFEHFCNISNMMPPVGIVQRLYWGVVSSCIYDQLGNIYYDKYGSAPEAMQDWVYRIQEIALIRSRNIVKIVLYSDKLFIYKYDQFCTSIQP